MDELINIQQNPKAINNIYKLHTHVQLKKDITSTHEFSNVMYSLLENGSREIKGQTKLNCK